MLATLEPFPASFRGGVSVAFGDVDGDRERRARSSAAAPGMPAQVKVYDARTHALLETLHPFAPSFRGGVSVAAGDLTGGGKADVIVGCGPGTKPEVAVFAGAERRAARDAQPVLGLVHGRRLGRRR